MLLMMSEGEGGEGEKKRTPTESSEARVLSVRGIAVRAMTWARSVRFREVKV